MLNSDERIREMILEIGPSRSLRRIAAEMHRFGISTAAGEALHPQTVARLLQRLGMPQRAEIRQADALHLALPPNSIDCVVTSPPYAMQRSKIYPSVPEAAYPAWSVEWMRAIRPALKPSANVLIVIRPHVRKGRISDYVLRTRLALREDGWIECDELIWHKPNAPPLGHKWRPRRSWESILWFSPSRKSYCNPQAGGQPSQQLGIARGRYYEGERAYKAGIARITDIVTVPADGDADSDHPAQFPIRLAERLIETFCPSRGYVIDPFSGAGTTTLAARNVGRRSIGSDVSEHFVAASRERLKRSLCNGRA